MNDSLNINSNLDLSKHSLNGSSSKQKFSFSKADRFGQRKSSLCDSIYQIPTTRGKRTTSFGYGNKTIGVRINKNTPEPCTYTIQGQFTNSHKRGVSFGQGRQKLLLGGPLRQSILRKYIPGPGNYQSAYSTMGTPKISLKSKIADNSLDHLKKYPGPGTYELEEFASKKYYASSKCSYGGGVKMSSPVKLQPILRKASLGPGSYDSLKTQMNPQGKYFISKYENSKSKVFSKSKRQTLVNKNQLYVPGPGNYTAFSSFG